VTQDAVVFIEAPTGTFSVVHRRNSCRSSIVRGANNDMAAERSCWNMKSKASLSFSSAHATRRAHLRRCGNERLPYGGSCRRKHRLDAFENGLGGTPDFANFDKRFANEALDLVFANGRICALRGSLCSMDMEKGRECKRVAHRTTDVE
jgi:hypothetical protein